METGFYSISTKILGLPLALISGNVSKVYMEEAAKEYNATGKFSKAFNKTFLFLSIIAVPMFFAMYFLAPPVCAWIFGADWIVAGEYIRVLSIMFTMRLVATALSPGLYVCRKQLAEFFVQGSLLLVTVAAGIVAYFCKYDIYSFLRIVAWLRSVVLVAQILTVYYYARGGGKKSKEEKTEHENSEEIIST